MAEDRRGEGEGRERREPRLRDFARRFLEGEEQPHEDRARMDAREMIGAVLETGDKAKTEVVRMVAREVRAYLEALEIGEDIRDLLTNYSLEVHASFHLRPLDEDEEEGQKREARVRRRRPPKKKERQEGQEEERSEETK